VAQARAVAAEAALSRGSSSRGTKIADASLLHRTPTSEATRRRTSDSPWSLHKPHLPAPEEYALLEQKMLEKALGSHEKAQELIAQRDAAQGFANVADARHRVFAAAAGSPPSSLLVCARGGT